MNRLIVFACGLALLPLLWDEVVAFVDGNVGEATLAGALSMIVLVAGIFIDRRLNDQP